MATVTVRNPTNGDLLLRGDRFDGFVTSADGDKIEHPDTFYKSTRSERIDRNLAPGEEATGRIAWTIDKDWQPAKLTLWVNDSHHFVFDVSDVK